MSSEEIKTIYKKLVQSYVNDYPRADPLWVLNEVLNKHIEAYIRYEWKAKEPAILDLALRNGIEIPKVKELMEKGRTRKEAIVEVSKKMQFQISETEVENWLKELRKEKLRKVKKVAKREMEPQIKDYEKTREEEIAKPKWELFGLPTPPPTEPTKGLNLKTISKYFIHGLAFSILFLILGIVMVFILAILVSLGSIIGLIIGIGLLFLSMGALNGAITDLLWFKVSESLLSALFHGIFLFVMLLIVDGVFIWVPRLTFPNLYVRIHTFIVGTLQNGLVGKTVGGFWKET